MNSVTFKKTAEWKTGQWYAGKNNLPTFNERTYIRQNVGENLLTNVKSNPSSPHRYANCLTSSQILCFNFFEPLKANPQILLSLLSQQICNGVNIGAKFVIFEFEYQINKFKQLYSLADNTMLDLYLKTDLGYEFYLEIKYAEQGFTPREIRDSDDRYWEGIYEPMCKDSKFLSPYCKDDFYSPRLFQINRNVGLVSNSPNNKEYVVFIYPFINDLVQIELTNYVQSLKTQNLGHIKLLDWKDMVRNVQSLQLPSTLSSHYLEFQGKYIWW